MATDSTQSSTQRPTRKRLTKPAATESSNSTQAKPSLETMVLSSTLEPLNTRDLVATAAYFLAERRNFAPGYELQDWLTAEQQVMGAVTPKH